MATFTQTCNADTIGWNSGMSRLGVNLLNSTFQSQTVTAVTFTLSAPSGQQTGVNLDLWYYDHNGVNANLIDQKTGLTINTTETDIVWSGISQDLGSQGGYIMMELSVGTYTLKMVAANSTISTPCSPSSTLAPASKIDGGALSTFSSDYPKVSITHDTTSGGGSGGGGSSEGDAPSGDGIPQTERLQILSTVVPR